MDNEVMPSDLSLEAAAPLVTGPGGPRCVCRVAVVRVDVHSGV